MKRLAIVSSHPIQYNAPFFRLLSERSNICIKVFYTWGKAVTENKFDPGFGKIIHWDIPLLDGYEYLFLQNTSTDPGTHHYKGIINPSLNNEIESWKADAVLVFGWNFHSHLKCIRHFHNKIPVLFRGDSTLLDEKKGIKKILRRLFLKWVYRHVDIALYVGTNNQKYFLAHGFKIQHLIYAPHAIDNERFCEPASLYRQQAIELKKTLGFKFDDIVLLFAGKMEDKKNPLYLVELLQRVGNKQLKVLFVGSGTLQKKVELALDKNDRVVLMDFQNQQLMPVIYRVADLFILPSTGPGETWGLAINEAMAAGKAVVASQKVGGAIDLITDGVNGLILDLENNTPLLNLLNASLGDNQLLVEMGRQSQTKIKDFTFNHIVKAIEKCVMAERLNNQKD